MTKTLEQKLIEANERCGHFLGGGEQKARDDFGFDGVDFAFHSTLSVISYPR